MDPIESMLCSINPVPDESIAPSALDVGLDLGTEPDASRQHPATPQHPATSGKDHDAAGSGAVRTGWFTAARTAAIVVAAVVVIVAGGFFALFSQNRHTPEPALPTPSPSIVQTPTPAATDPATDSAAIPPMDPATGIACTFENVGTTSQSGQMLRNMEDFPGDFTVLGCAGGWLAFELAGDGYQRLLGQGAGNGSGDGNGARGDFYFADFDGTGYRYNKYNYSQGWDTIQAAGGTPADKGAEMDRRLEYNLGISADLRTALVGEPPQDQATEPPATAPPAADPGTGIPCTMDRVKPADNPQAWVMQDINAAPENYTVLACSGGWLSFELSDAGYQSWLDAFEREGLQQESSPFFYFAKFDGSNYAFKLENTVPNWQPRPGVDQRPEPLIQEMERDLEGAGIPAALREALVGSPPQ